MTTDKKRQERFIKIAEIGILESPGILKTVVGSCIALCIWDGRKKIGGMVHIMMPKGDSRSAGPEGKYADSAVKALYREMTAKNCRREDMTVSLIGGASLFENRLGGGRRKPIGIENYEAVKQQVEMHRLSILTEAVGGTSGRRITFNCLDGVIEITNLKNGSYSIAGGVTERDKMQGRR